MQFDRRAFLATLGTAAAINAMPSEALADALEHHMMENLDEETTTNELKVRRGTGLLFGGPGPSGKAPAELKKLEPMPEKPTLVDFFRYRFEPATQSISFAKVRNAEDCLSSCYPQISKFFVAPLLLDI
jgi:hypothetical protein